MLLFNEGQEISFVKVNTKQIGVEDIVDVLNVMRVKMFHFDLMPSLFFEKTGYWAYQVRWKIGFKGF